MGVHRTASKPAPSRAGRRLDGLRRTALFVIWIACLLVAVAGITRSFHHRVLGLDSRAYWLSGHLHRLYVKPPGSDDAYLYSPAFATAIGPITRFPLAAFETLWTVVESACFAWLLKPLGWTWGVPLFAVCFIEALEGDIYGLMGVACVVGFRLGGTWAFVLLTKIAPGLGLLWFAVRREWRHFGAALGVTALVVAVSLTVSPQRWSQWVHFLLDHRQGGSAAFPLRFVAAVLLTILAARTDRAWLLVVAMTLAMPRFGNLPTYTMLAAVPRAVLASATPRRRRFTPDRDATRAGTPPNPTSARNTAVSEGAGSSVEPDTPRAGSSPSARIGGPVGVVRQREPSVPPRHPGGGGT